MSRGYTVGVGQSWHQSDGSSAPDRTCGHAHRTLSGALWCGEKLWGAGYVRGQWQASAEWAGYYVIGPDGHKVKPL